MNKLGIENYPNYSAEVRQLSKREKAWLYRLERVLMSCPNKRLGLATIGDAELIIYDQHIAENYDVCISDGGARKAGVMLATVSSAVCIEGVSG